MKEGWRDARGEAGAPRICSAKLPRCDRWSGLDMDMDMDILSDPGGGERPSEAVELLRDCSGEGVGCSFLLASASAMVEGASMWAGARGCGPFRSR